MYGKQTNWGDGTSLSECLGPLGGAFTFILLTALPLAVMLTWVTVFQYRRHVSRSMRLITSDHTPPANSEPSTQLFAPPANALALKYISDETKFAATNATTESSRKLRSTTAAYALAGVAHAVFVTALTLFLADIELLPVRFSSIVLIYLWPIVPAFILTSVGDSRVKWISLVTYFVLIGVVEWALYASDSLQQPNAGALFLVWLVWMGPPSFLLWLLSNRAWRSVGLSAYLVCCALVGGWLLATQGLGCLALSQNNVSLWTTFRWPALGLAIVLAAGFAWWRLNSVSRRYRKKEISDQLLTLDSWWLVITLVEIVIQFDATGGKSVSFLLAYFVFLGVRRILLPSKPGNVPHPLLLLRVFGHSKRSRKLLDQLSQRWRMIGPINLIGAPDVAATNLEPDELMQYWSGNGRAKFIGNSDELNQRLQTLDEHTDPDGRYRVNEFFCHDNTWKDTVFELAQYSKYVLMDLRGFGPENRGCEFEISMLLREVPLEKTVLLIDDTTDVRTLEHLLNQIWEALPAHSPNYLKQESELLLFETSGPIRSAVPLLSLLTN